MKFKPHPQQQVLNVQCDYCGGMTDVYFVAHGRRTCMKPDCVRKHKTFGGIDPPGFINPRPMYPPVRD